MLCDPSQSRLFDVDYGEGYVSVNPALLYDDRFQSLKPAERSALVGIWVLAVHNRRIGPLRASPKHLSAALGQRVTRQTLRALNEAGFIALAASRESARASRRAAA